MLTAWCSFCESSPAQDQLAAAAPRQTLPGLGLAIAADLETATGALEAPAKLQQIPADQRPSSQAASPAAREAVTCSRAAISSLVSFSLGLDPPSAASFCWSCSPRSQFPLVWLA